MSGDLAAFWAARLDEKAARAGYIHDGAKDSQPLGGTGRCVCGHPAQVDREVAAGRAILELHAGAHECPAYDHNGDIDNCAWWPEGDCTTLRLRAAVHSGHPDYDPEWKP